MWGAQRSAGDTVGIGEMSGGGVTAVLIVGPVVAVSTITDTIDSR